MSLPPRRVVRVGAKAHHNSTILRSPSKSSLWTTQKPYDTGVPSSIAMRPLLTLLLARCAAPHLRPTSHETTAAPSLDDGRNTRVHGARFARTAREYLRGIPLAVQIRRAGTFWPRTVPTVTHVMESDQCQCAL